MMLSVPSTNRFNEKPGHPLFEANEVILDFRAKFLIVNTMLCLPLTRIASFLNAWPPNAKRDYIMRKLRASMRNDIPELTGKELTSGIPAQVRKRLIQGKFQSG
jgi:hypothetical protein